MDNVYRVSILGVVVPCDGPSRCSIINPCKECADKILERNLEEQSKLQKFLDDPREAVIVDRNGVRSVRFS